MTRVPGSTPVLSLADAQAAVRRAGFSSRTADLKGYAAIVGLPLAPEQAYPDWPGWPAFLGTGRRCGPFLPLEAFTRSVREFGITSSTEYARRYRTHPAWPANPDQYCRDWPGWRAVLQKWDQPRRLRPSEVVSFEEARRVARAAGWRTSRAYRDSRRAHPGLPLRPDRHDDGWEGWPAFLGVSDRQRVYQSTTARQLK